MQQLLLATHNRHKTEEFRQMLGDRYEVVDMTILPQLPPAEETGQTFEENAAIKALHAAAVYEGLVVADDSGLEVDALNGVPGVYSSRYAGAEATDAENIAKLLQALAGVSGPWSARFRCVLVWARGSRVEGRVTGAVEGEIVSKALGHSGFGYDPVFRPKGWQTTMAQLTAEEKNRLSHRAVAVGRLKQELLLSGKVSGRGL